MIFIKFVRLFQPGLLQKNPMLYSHTGGTGVTGRDGTPRSSAPITR